MTDDDLDAQLRTIAERFSAAIVSNDPALIASFLSPDWRLVDADGVTTRERFLDVVGSGRLTHSRMFAVTELDVRIHGAVGVVLARVVNTAHFDGDVFEADEWTTDVFVRRDGRWLCDHSHVTAASP